MAFTFAEDLSLDRDYVRFHSADTIEDQSVLSDALITSMVSVEGTKQKAVIAAIQYKIGLFSQPNFKADWLQVDNRTAVASLKDLLKEKRAELGVAQYTATVTHVYRADSAAIAEPDYTDGRP
jgi:hypothetical protein